MSGPRARGASAAAVDAHIEQMRMRGLAPMHVLKRKRVLCHLQATLDTPLLDATPAGLERWRAGLTVAPATVAHYVSAVRCFYAFCVERRFIRSSPAASLPAPRVRKGLPRPIGEDALMRALATAPPRIRPWLVLAAWAGLRSQEVARLRGEDVVLKPAPLLIVSAFAAKGGRERVVPLSPFVVAELIAAGLPARGWVFTRMDGRRGANQPWVISQLSNEHLHDCGLTDTLHSLRHRFGSATYQASRDLRAVQDMMGHADPATTAIYTAFAESAATAAVAALPVPGPDDDGPPIPRPEDGPDLAPGWTAPVVHLQPKAAQ